MEPIETEPHRWYGWHMHETGNTSGGLPDLGLLLCAMSPYFFFE